MNARDCFKNRRTTAIFKSIQGDVDLQIGVEDVNRPRESRGLPAPVNVGDVHTVKIESKGKGGDGLARVQGFVVFVPGVNVGDEVKIRIKELRRRFAIAEVVTE